jgi:hypothetical protein
MAEATSSAAKVCAACSKDVSTLPRTKDAQGRYFCKECVDKLKAKAATAKSAPAKPATATAPPTAPGEHDVMAKLLSDTPGVELCPNCGGGVTVGSKICVRCGFNKETGKAMKVVVERAAKDKEEKTSKRGGSFVLSEGMYLLILCALVGGGFGLSMFNPAFGVLLYAICFILFLVAWVWGIIAAFKDEESLAGICGIVGFFIGLSWIYFVYWCIFGTWRGYLKMTMTAALLGLVLGAVGVVGHGDDGSDMPHSRSTQRGRATAPKGTDQTTGDEKPSGEAPAPSDGTVLGG